jgi:hypothetical protein
MNVIAWSHVQTLIAIVFFVDCQAFSNNFSSKNLGLEPLIFLFTLTLVDKIQIYTFICSYNLTTKVTDCFPTIFCGGTRKLGFLSPSNPYPRK